MFGRIPSIRPISDLARDARAVISEARSKYEPVVITQRGREVAVLLPVDLYRELESRSAPRIMSPRLARPDEAKRFTMTVTVDEVSHRSASHSNRPAGGDKPLPYRTERLRPEELTD